MILACAVINDILAFVIMAATGRGMIGSICGIFFLIVFLVLVYRFYKAFFYPIRVLTKTEGKNKVYEYKPSLAERIDQEEAGLSWLVAFISAAVFFSIGRAIYHMI